MNGSARLIDGPFSEGIETVTSLVRCAGFTAELGKRIRQPGGAERAVSALRREFFEPLPLGQPEGGHPYRGGPQNGGAASMPNGNPSGFSAPVVYVQPEFEELRRRFPAYVNHDYGSRRFDPIERCRAVSKENREVVFEVVHLGRKFSTDMALAAIDHKRYRPALYEELLGFAEKYPDEQGKYPIVALGSEARVDDDRFIAYLWCGGSGRFLGLHRVDSDWYDYFRFLVVRK